MIDSELISVVMPAFNASEYIAETIECILAQDYQNFELVICDDYSADNTCSIIEGFNDSRVRLIKTDSNSGSAKYPRELAIENSRGNLICWIDSDDIVPVDYLSKLYNRKVETSASIVCSRMVAIRAGVEEYTLPRMGFDYSKVLAGPDAMMMTIGFPWQINLNGWLCDKKLWIAVSSFKNKTIRHMDADDYSAREILFKAEKVAFCLVNYYYRLHQNSITKKLSVKKFESIITDFLVYDFVKKHYPKASKKVLEMICHRMVSLTCQLVVYRNCMSDDDVTSVTKLLAKYHKRLPFGIVHSKELSFKHKLLLLLPYKTSIKIIQFVN